MFRTRVERRTAGERVRCKVLDILWRHSYGLYESRPWKNVVDLFYTITLEVACAIARTIFQCEAIKYGIFRSSWIYHNLPGVVVVFFFKAPTISPVIQTFRYMAICLYLAILFSHWIELWTNQRARNQLWYRFTRQTKRQIYLFLLYFLQNYPLIWYQLTWCFWEWWDLWRKKVFWCHSQMAWTFLWLNRTVPNDSRDLKWRRCKFRFQFQETVVRERFARWSHQLKAVFEGGGGVTDLQRLFFVRPLEVSLLRSIVYPSR